MKHILKLAMSILLILIFTAGCDTDELHNLNINPNAVTEIDMNFFMTTAILGMASAGPLVDNRNTDYTNLGFAGHAIQHFAGTGTSAGDKYFEENISNVWQYFYRDSPKYAAEIIKQTGPGGIYEGKQVNTRSAARIIRPFWMHRLTDFYGNIPYSEAHRGIEGIYQPKYDKQKDIYIDCLKELDEACAAFNASDMDYPNFAKADFLFHGDVEKWKKFGYSLMLRLAMRVSNVDPGLAANYVTKAVAGGTMAGNGDNAWAQMAMGPYNWVNQNGLSRSLWPGDGGLWSSNLFSKTFIDILKGSDPSSTADDDPRLYIFTQGPIKWSATDLGVILEPDPLKWIGLPVGYDASMINNEYGGGNPVTPYEHFCAINTKMLRIDAPYLLMYAAESEFLKAEAILRNIGTVPGTAQSHYEAGVRLAMQMYTPLDPSFTVTDARVDTYLSQYPYDEANALEQIGTQLWISKFLMWWDSWSDWRRTGYPVLVEVNYPGNATGGKIPRKFLYPPAEAAGNPNFADGATKPDKMTTRVWWDGGSD
ncbi:MAG TPA: SusD/RagB family nutrient-binding outer membrane lipoprotein [Bacteroidales bacterium]|nr:SusD/RagB family nutrient-binding outer membrane lipoprotein [Bacteroidales bacterium]HNR43311.1 SusD/RagB family nutrient-binding outer membrane lipoprotein [Bacteroidales bacterium]HQG78708.1 SusD/RagB family nutrient-binding outer membrane lipoprotein [Bacteroidales bacterium]